MCHLFLYSSCFLFITSWAAPQTVLTNSLSPIQIQIQIHIWNMKTSCNELLGSFYVSYSLFILNSQSALQFLSRSTCSQILASSSYQCVSFPWASMLRTAFLGINLFSGVIIILEPQQAPTIFCPRTILSRKSWRTMQYFPKQPVKDNSPLPLYFWGLDW